MENIKTKLLISICEKGKEKKLFKYLKRNKITYNLTINGQGTASSSLMEYFGLTEVKKEVILSVIPEVLEGKILYDFHNKYEIYKPGHGISFTTSITSATRYLSNIYSNINVKEKIKVENDKEYELIVLIVSEGYSSVAMTAAKRKMAGGGTLIRGIGLGTKEAKKFLGLTIEPEKDVVLILTDKENKKSVMEEITNEVGLSHEGRGICFSIPVDSVVGLSENIKFETIE